MSLATSISPASMPSGPLPRPDRHGSPDQEGPSPHANPRKPSLEPIRVGVLLDRPLDASAYAAGLASSVGFQAKALTCDVLGVSAEKLRWCSVLLTDCCLRQALGIAERPRSEEDAVLPEAVVLPRASREALSGRPCLCCRWLHADCGWRDLQTALRRFARRTSVDQAADEPDMRRAFERLTARERDVLLLIAEGYSVRQCAAELGLAESTIGNHKYRMMRKLDVSTSLEMLRLAIRHGVVDP